MLGIGTGEFIMECSSDSFRCEGLARFAGTSTGLGGALVEFAGVEECEPPCADIESRLPSPDPFGGCDGRRSLMVWNLDSSSWRVVEEVPLPLDSW